MENFLFSDESIIGGLHFEEMPMLEAVFYLLYYNMFFL